MFVDMVIRILGLAFISAMLLGFAYMVLYCLLRIPFGIIGQGEWFDKIWSKPLKWIGIKGAIRFRLSDWSGCCCKNRSFEPFVDHFEQFPSTKYMNSPGNIHYHHRRHSS